jgi:hypothetical protein
MFQRRNRTWQCKRQQSLRRRQATKKTRRSKRSFRHELLEDRCMFALLGVVPDLPIIGYDSGGTVSYDATADAFSIDATPLTITSTSGVGFFFTGDLDINIQVDASGALVGGVPGDDLLLVGDVDVDGDFVVDFSGTLLTGEVLAFGHEDSGGNIDLYDFRFSVTGGQLASMFSGKDLGVTTTSENSSFTGDFNVDFGGNAKGSIGAIDPLNPGIDIEKLVNGVDADNPEEGPEINPGETVTFQYQVTNTGDVPYAFADVDVTDDNGTPGNPGDDVSTTGGQIVFLPGSDVGSDGILSPGEQWLYEFETTAEDLAVDDCGCEVGIHVNTAVVNVPGATDSDVAHYTNPSDAPPCIGYDSGGTVSYDATNDRFSLNATPLSNEDGGLFFTGSFIIDIIVDGSGMLVGGVPGDDLVLTGDYDVDGDFIVDYSGILLTGEILSFVSNDSGGNIDTYEFTFMITGGLLAGQYAGMGLKVETTSENSTFTGDFSTSFGGNAKGEICCFCIETANLSGKKYTDHTGDGISGDDTPLAGVTINLYQDFGTIGVRDGADVLYASDVTDINGEYSFTNVPPGNYLVEEIVPAGYVPTTPTVLAVTLAPHDNITTGFDFANFELGSISGQKFNDLDGDGTNDGGSDPGLAGWTIELDKDADGSVDATTVTGPGGAYSFTGLVAGTYRIREQGQVGWIQTTVNPGDVSVVSGTDSTGNDFGNRQRVPGIDMEKTTNGPTNSNPTAPDYDNEDSADGPGVPILTPGSTVTWTYKVTNTGETDYAFGEVVVVDDNGTPGNAADDMSTTNGQITFQSVQVGDADNVLEPGEVWLYSASGVVQSLGTMGSPVTFNFSGSSAGDGPEGNIRTFSAGGVSVNASAWSRDPGGGWTAAFLGSYPGGLGVTDNIEGDGSNNRHTVDNVGNNNYVLFEFSDTVVVDSAFLGYVVNDSDMTIWIGTATDPFNNHLALNDAVLTSLGFTEVNLGDGSTRWADFNAGNMAGNVLVIAARVDETDPLDRFKIEKVKVRPFDEMCYENKAVVTVPGATDFDFSHYCTPHIPPEPGIDIEKFTNGVDADNENEAPQVAPGELVTWTYHVTNTGNVSFTAAQIVVTDDDGTPGNLGDDFHPTLVASSDVGNDGILSPDETWIYTASAPAQNLGSGAETTFNFSGNSATDGTDGNIRTFTSGGVSVKASAWSRDSAGVWETAYLGSYGGGLGVTDRSETGSDNSHTVDNTGRDNYVLFEFSETVVVDEAFLGYVVNDSDLRIWIGTLSDPFNNHQALSDEFLSDLGFTEVNETTLSTTRWADLNAGGLSGNVIVIAANTAEPTTEDNFKIEKLTVGRHDCYQNLAVVTAPGATDSDSSFYCNPQTPPDPRIDIEKFTNGVDADTAAEAPEIAPGQTVTWTYQVTNTGTVAFAASEVVVTDDNGTAGNTADDFSPTLVASSDVGNDGILSPGEMWTYTASATAQDLMTTGATSTFNFAGSSGTTGSAGNIRTFAAGGVSVKTSAFSRDKASGAWSAAYLGSYSGGLGVTDGSENGSSNTHTVDNNASRDNYVLFEFSQSIVVDSAFLGYVVTDSDLSVWIGSTTDPFNNHLTLSDAVLSGLGFTEVNAGGSSTRTADINAGKISGNVLVIAAKKGETNDYFKIQKLNFQKLELGIYKNIGTVTADGVSDTDVSHYKNPECTAVTFAFAGNTSTTGTAGNIRTYTVNGVSVNASAFSRTTAGTWNTAYLGAYSQGLGVTDGGENGSNGTHRLDNIDRMDFILFEFSTLVEIDRAFLDSIVGDSDVSIFFGTANNPFHNHLTLSDTTPGMTLSYYETDNTDSTGSRWADFESGGIVGNVLIIAASVEDDTPDDQFKVSQLDVCAKAVKFYTVDSNSDDTFEYGPSGQALANYNLNTYNTNPRGVATTAAGAKVWVVDGNKKVYVYDTNGVLQGSWTANGLSTPEDITTNGTDIWIVDDGSNKVFKYSAAASRTSGSQSAAASFTLNSANANAKGIVTDGTHLWVVNDVASGADKVFKYTLSGTLVGSWTIDSANGSPTGITLDPSSPDHLWITDIADNAVYRYNGATGYTSGTYLASHVFQLAGGNGDVQGIADPPPGGDGLTSSVDFGLFALPRNVNSGKDRVLSDWAPAASALEGRLAGAISALRSDGSLTSTALSRGNNLLGLNRGSRVNGTTSFALDQAFDNDDADADSDSDLDWESSVDAMFELVGV